MGKGLVQEPSSQQPLLPTMGWSAAYFVFLNFEIVKFDYLVDLQSH